MATNGQYRHANMCDVTLARWARAVPVRAARHTGIFDCALATYVQSPFTAHPAVMGAEWCS